MMKMKPTNFARFFELARLLNYSGMEQEEFKATMVRQFTDGRTDSLREMTVTEYNAMCSNLDKTLHGKAQYQLLEQKLKRARGMVLGKIEEWGIQPSNHAKVDEFCKDRRIAGKRFVLLSEKELHSLYRKLIKMIELREQKKAEALKPKAPIIPINQSTILQANET